MGRTSLDHHHSDPPVVPGFAVVRLLGLGAHGAVWAAREQTTGSVVALKIGRPPDRGPGATEADLLARIDHPHLIRLRQVITLPDGATALVLDLAEGGSLASLIAARGQLEPGEVVTLLIPLSDALAELHARGIAHGDLAPGNVLFTADGRPMLSDLGVSRVLGARPAGMWGTPGFTDPAAPGAGPASDVWGLGALAWFALTAQPPPGPDSLSMRLGAQVPPALQMLIGECLSRAPQERPPAGRIAARAWHAAAPARIRLVARDDTPPRADLSPSFRLITAPASRAPREAGAEAHRPARITRWHVLGALLGSLLAGLMLLAVGLRSARPAGNRLTAEKASVANALEQIAAARANAFEHASMRPLVAADEPGSAAEDLDVGLVERLTDAGIRLDGLWYLIRDVQPVASAGGLLDVTAVVTTSAHRQVRAMGERKGSVVREVPAEGPQRLRLRLVRGARSGPDGSGGWLVRAVDPLTPAPARSGQ